MWLNYPNNPTAAVAPRASSPTSSASPSATASSSATTPPTPRSTSASGRRASSSSPAAREVAIEFHSLSKTFNMTGWRVGFAAGHRELIAGLGKVKTNVDSGVFQAVQEAAIAALTGDRAVVDRLRAMYRERRDVLVAGIADIGLACDPPRGHLLRLVPVPRGHDGAALAARCLTEAGVVVTPGNGFGSAGRGIHPAHVAVVRPSGCAKQWTGCGVSGSSRRAPAAAGRRHAPSRLYRASGRTWATARPTPSRRWTAFEASRDQGRPGLVALRERAPRRRQDVVREQRHRDRDRVPARRPAEKAEGDREAMGRKRVKGKRWGSRVIDLDILLADNEIVDKRRSRSRIRRCTSAASSSCRSPSWRRP